MRIPKIFQNTAIYMVVMVLQKGLSFFLLPLYTSFLSPSDYGILGVVTSISSLLAVFITMGLDAAAARYYYKNSQDASFSKRLYGTVASSILTNAVLFGTIVILCHKFIIDPLIGDIPFYPYVFLGLLNVIVTPLYLLFQNYCQTIQDGTRYGINAVCFIVIHVTLIVIALAVLHLGVVGVLLANLAVAVIFFIYVIFAFFRHQQIGFDKPILKETYSYSLPLIPHFLANWSNGTLDKLLINGIRTEVDAGLYNLGQQYGSVMSFVANAINQSYTPWFYEKMNHPHDSLSQIRKTAEFATFALSLIGIILSLFSKEILSIMITNPAYDGVWRIIPCIVFAYVFQGVYFFFVNILFLKNTNVIFTITVTAVAVNVGLNLLLIPVCGYVGGAIACLASFFTKSVMALVVSQKKNKDIRLNWPLMYGITILALFFSLIPTFVVVNSFFVLFSIKITIVVFCTIIFLLKYKTKVSSIIIDIRSKR